ncbi:MAG: RICIN domain-containing protein [Oscillospiraceae bacterium]|nr:RICIN domain-containing protein [Oscillospiraceae bacterium]
MQEHTHLPLIRFAGFLTVLAMLLAVLFPADFALTADAVSTDYPVQLMNIAVKDNSKVLTESGMKDNSGVSTEKLGNTLAPSWRFDRVGADSNGTYFKLCNAESGRLLTPSGYNVTAGTDVVIYGYESAQSQHWYVIPVKQDHLGNDLYYKIVNYSDPSLALTQNASGTELETYTGADSQLWLLNADGLQGFAGYCKDDNTGNIKAGDVGGLFGETVEVSTFDDLKKYATSDTPYTIVVTEDIKVNSLKQDSSGRNYCPDGRIYVHSNKTIIGSYSKHTLYNVQFCTATKNGVGDNLIIKNFDLQHDSESNGNDSIVVYFGSGENLWVDHVTFTGHKDYNTASTGLEDWDKFLACCYDADYCTVSDCSFGLHEYGLILGYPDDTESVKNQYDNYPRMSLVSNQFYQTLTRGPGLMRWGYYHSLNNYVNTFSMAYTVHSGCDIYAENCYYENGGNVICDWNEITFTGAYAESGSKSSNCKRTTIEGSALNSKWRPSGNYDYVTITADEAKVYCSSYSGVQTDRINWMYLRYASKGVPSAGYFEAPNGEPAQSDPPVPVAAEFAEGSAYRIKNINSGLYLEVAGAEVKNGANVQQWGSDGSETHNIWKFFSAGNGYYYLASAVGDGGTYVLDVAGKKTANGTNIDIYQYNGGTNQQFMLTQNADGSYKICTRISGETSVVEVADASTESGANIQQWDMNGMHCQNWILESVTDPGVSMDTSVRYSFTNANSGLVLEVKDGTMTDDANIQQWVSNDSDCQKWILKSFGSENYYYIRSAQDQNYVLKAMGSANGDNIALITYSSKDSAMLFRFTKNLDGTYRILTHASKDVDVVEVASASTENGANIQQWETNGNACQNWTLTTEAIPVVTEPTQESTPEPTESEQTEPSTQETSTESSDIILWGDANNDGTVDIRDVVLMNRVYVGVDQVTDKGLINADVDQSGKIELSDSMNVLRLLVHLLTPADMPIR